MADIVSPGEPAGGPLNSGAMPKNYDMVIYKGDYVELFITLKDPLGAAINLSGFTPKAQLKANYEGPMIKEFACALTATVGQVRIYLSSSVSSSLIPGDYIWDFQITSSGLETRTYLAGDVVVNKEVTT
jgi:hypothetical protein